MTCYYKGQPVNMNLNFATKKLEITPMTNFDKWRSSGRLFSPDDAEAMFGWDGRDDVIGVFVHSGPTFIEILVDGTTVFGGVAMEDSEMAEEAAFHYYMQIPVGTVGDLT